MRILHFLPVYAPAWQFGGPILSVSRLCEGLVQQGVEVRVITTNAGLPDFPTEQLAVPQYVNGVQVIYYPVDHAGGVIRSNALVQALSLHMLWADLVHVSSIWQPLGLSVQKAAHACGLPVIQTLRGALGPYSWRRSWWKKYPYFLFKERPLLQRASSLHCTTSKEAREIRWLGLKPPVQLLPNPLDLSTLRYDPEYGETWRYKVGITSEEPLLLVAGRLHHKKGLDLLPKVLHRLRRHSWQVLFIGQDEDGTVTMLRNNLKRYRLTRRCIWMNPLPAEELLGPYNAADMLLLPSRHENFGNVVIEALACGCPVIASSHVGVSEELDGCPGFYSKDRTVAEWANTISRLLSATKPGDRSEHWVKTRYGRHSIAIKALDMYSSLLER